jgi:hypothetical protein
MAPMTKQTLTQKVAVLKKGLANVKLVGDKEPGTVEDAVRELLASYGEVREACGILAVRLSDGTLWDMTVPMVVKRTPAFEIKP